MEMTRTAQSCYRLFATVFSYPTTEYQEAVGSLAESAGLSPEVSGMLARFKEAVAGLNLAGLEEAFTYTFDLNPDCCLELGWHLYGETYKRGEFLVTMRQYLRNFGIPETSELPDHLSHCLLVLENLSPDNAVSFTQTYINPALGKIVNAVPEDNPYRSCILALQTHLTKKYSINED
ncbi:MAG: hypothetical protein GXO91_05770 [FCB group bacterium]|nr:hypothetical protein [FCB group bacterium]